ncbi:hypothetical protein P171DRAFT_194050 [Karstenula rhodostoma CBS 690.94]|uniref:Uncharacterized protein n=1 Tax=Karstenula rhodostoma CBS 690.94 TaxID=1392251 RepID=A0A9P4PUG7_9PLEO|nr:hypothetical protein P171DRAFT_194050 [Karstenula rhodostoma CBS 690.94]
MQVPSSNPTSSRLPPTMWLVGSCARAVRDGDELTFHAPLQIAGGSPKAELGDTRQRGQSDGEQRQEMYRSSKQQSSLNSDRGGQGVGTCREDSEQTQAWRHTVAAANRERLAPGIIRARMSRTAASGEPPKHTRGMCGFTVSGQRRPRICVGLSCSPQHAVFCPDEALSHTHEVEVRIFAWANFAATTLDTKSSRWDKTARAHYV